MGCGRAHDHDGLPGPAGPLASTPGSGGVFEGAGEGLDLAGDCKPVVLLLGPNPKPAAHRFHC